MKNKERSGKVRAVFDSYLFLSKTGKNFLRVFLGGGGSFWGNKLIRTSPSVLHSFFRPENKGIAV